MESRRIMLPGEHGNNLLEREMQNLKLKSLWLAACVVIVLAGSQAAAVAMPLLTPQKIIHIPGGTHGIGFDDIGYFPALGKVSIPAGQTGELVLLDPQDGKVAASYRVTATDVATHGHEQGTSSAVYAEGYIFASDHGEPGVVILDARDGKLLERVRLDSGPDYVRYLQSSHELWVTEPRAQQIQVFSINPGRKPMLTAITAIHIAGGPESLVFDTGLDRAYSNLWKDKTVVMDTKTHALIGEWSDTCKGPRGLALDADKGFLFVACTEGKVAVLDVKHGGKVLATAPSGAGIDIISYDPASGHLYVPGARSASMTIFRVSPAGSLQPLAMYRTAKGAHCVTDDGKGTAFVCDPHAGTILEIRSP
jgi:hypothetical protein